MPSIGERGQAAIDRASVRVDGADLAAEICALYLAGAGVGDLELDARLAPRARAQNGEIRLGAVSPSPSAGRRDEELTVHVFGEGGGSFVTSAAEESDPVMRGSLAARWVLARILDRASREVPR